jgi:NitT/TauT family transport system substrate-binding protein
MKNNVFLIISLVSVLAVFGCAPADEGLKTSGEVMKVAKNYWPAQFWIEIAYEKGWFDEAGLNVELVDTNDDYFQGVQDFVDGKMDVNQFVLFDLMEIRTKGIDLVAVVDVGLSTGADAIVAKNDIENIKDLKSKKIGLQQGTFSEYILGVVLERSGLTKEDIIYVETTAEDIEPLVNGEVDALVIFEPFASQAVEQANGRKIFDSSQIPGLIPDVMAFHKRFIVEKPEDVQVYVNVWHRTTEFIKTNPEQAFQIIAEIYDVPLGDVQAFTQDVKILDLRENKVAFSYASGFESLHGTASQINDFMIEKGITDKNLDTLDFIDARFIRNVEE